LSSTRAGSAATRSGCEDATRGTHALPRSSGRSTGGAFSKQANRACPPPERSHFDPGLVPRTKPIAPGDAFPKRTRRPPGRSPETSPAPVASPPETNRNPDSRRPAVRTDLIAGIQDRSAPAVQRGWSSGVFDAPECRHRNEPDEPAKGFPKRSQSRGGPLPERSQFVCRSLPKRTRRARRDPIRLKPRRPTADEEDTASRIGTCERRRRSRSV
jgi:hypothetical protein